MLHSQETSRAALASTLADLQFQLEDAEEHKSQKGADLTTTEEKADALGRDCSWVASHFETRRTKRKAEMEGLVDAKSFLAGIDSGDEI